LARANLFSVIALYEMATTASMTIAGMLRQATAFGTPFGVTKLRAEPTWVGIFVKKLDRGP